MGMSLLPRWCGLVAAWHSWLAGCSSLGCLRAVGGWPTNPVQTHPRDYILLWKQLQFSILNSTKDNTPDFQHTWGINIHPSPTNQIKVDFRAGTTWTIFPRILEIVSHPKHKHSVGVDPVLCLASQKRYAGRCLFQHRPGHCASSSWTIAVLKSQTLLSVSLPMKQSL